MGCLIISILLFGPRLVLLYAAIATDWFSRAYETTIWPLLGFFFMPWTTLAYMVAMLNNDHHISGGWMLLMFVAIIADLGSNGTLKVKKSD